MITKGKILILYFRCSERKYDKSNFKGEVKEFPFEDHQAPSFDLVFRFCEDLVKLYI